MSDIDRIAEVLTAHRWSPAKDDARGGCYGCAYHGDYAGWVAHVTSNRRWSDEHSAKAEAIGRVIYDDQDDLFTVKTAPNTWVAYHTQGHLYTHAHQRRHRRRQGRPDRGSNRGAPMTDDPMSEAEKLITEVLQGHARFERWSVKDSGGASYWLGYECGDGCDWQGRTVAEFFEHVSAEIVKALGGLTRQWAAGEAQGLGVFRSSDDSREDAEVNVELYDDTVLVARWVSGWSEVTDA
jgi:hypothetical protein